MGHKKIVGDEVVRGVVISGDDDTDVVEWGDGTTTSEPKREN